MSKIRNKDTGTYAPHMTGVETQPTVDRLDFRTDAKRAPATNFRRGELGPDTGRARAHMGPESQGPTVPSNPIPAQE